MTFLETFLATSTTLLCAWLYKQFIEPVLNKNHNKARVYVKKVIKKWKKG